MAYFRCVGNSGSNVQISNGTFTSATSQYGIVTVNCGFEPDLVIVSLPLGDYDTTSYWWKESSMHSTLAIWDLLPAEWGQYMVNLGRSTGETGIQAMNNNGFSFMSNASNTQGVTCKYIAIKYT